jgi:AcrR family transcriptional regulator
MPQSQTPVEVLEEQSVKRAPGRPRSEQSRQAILASTLRLLQEVGFADLSIEAIAADANVGKATIYRWWPTKGALVADAFSSSADQELRFPDTGSVGTDVAQQMRQVARLFRSKRGRIVSALLAGGQSDPELLEAFRERFLRPRREEAYQTLRRGIQRGEIAEGIDLDLVLDTLYGAIYMRFMIRHDSLTDDFVTNVCELVMEGIAPANERRK